jgi:response regulator RpfG family c-di-GMP phosphodiesterase
MEQDRSTPQGPRLLLVEDDSMTRDLIARRLESRGCEVTAVDAAEEGIVEAGESKFDIVVSDVHLPGLSGIDLAGFMLSQEPDLPVILITGDRDEALAREAQSKGPVNYLLKPFEAFEIEAAVRQALVRRGWTADEESLGRRPVEGAPIEEAPAVTPSDWLRFVDQESYAGPGHGERVARIADHLHREVVEASAEISAADLSLAARVHEVGRLNWPDGEGPQVAMQSAELMAEAGFPRAAVRAVRHMFERWDGSGGPEALSESRIPLGAQILATADALDHYTAAWMRTGLNPDNAVDRAIHLISVQQDQFFGREMVLAVQSQREWIREICASESETGAQPALTTASYVQAMADVPFQAA